MEKKLDQNVYVGDRLSDVHGMGTLTIDLRGCPRCGKDHPTHVFRPLANGVKDLNAGYWAPCFQNAEPILMAIHDVNDATQDTFH